MFQVDLFDEEERIDSIGLVQTRSLLPMEDLRRIDSRDSVRERKGR